jgi:dephospho-CoA kinase
MIIGLTGYARTGKDTVASVLVKDFGFERIAFADPIRELLYELNPKVNGIYLREMVEEHGWE